MNTNKNILININLIEKPIYNVRYYMINAKDKDHGQYCFSVLHIAHHVAQNEVM